MEDGLITVDIICFAKASSTLADASLVLTQIKFKISRVTFLSNKEGSISAKNSRVSLPGHCKLLHRACLVKKTVYLFEEKPIVHFN